MRRSFARVAGFRGAALLLVAAAGCSGRSTTVENDPEALNQYGCKDIYQPDVLPTFEVDIAPEEWAAMDAEHDNWQAREAQGLALKPYHPITFRYQNEEMPAHIKLQANPTSSWHVEKMSFSISFNRIDREARFHGLRKLVLHAQPSDHTVLRERLALSYMRGLGLPAQCENNARLIVNGHYYGLYENREALNKDFLKRVFPGASDGDLWKFGLEIDTNEETADGLRRAQLFTNPTVETLHRMVDVDASLAVWAAEATLPDEDGYWGVDHNYYVYDHPIRGFIWIPYDLDATFDFAPFSADPLLWSAWWSHGWGPHQRVAFADPDLRARFVEKVEQALAGYDVALLKARLDAWQAQIEPALVEEPHRPFTMGDHLVAVGRVREAIPLRAKLLSSWLECVRTEHGEDDDGDRFIWCRDCDDSKPDINPSAPEICGNDVDENCNGRKDDCVP